MVNRLKSMDNKWARVVKFWFDRAKEGYVIELSIEYNEAERKFIAILRKILLEDITLWIKMLFVENNLMHMDPDRLFE
jgi:hypothetical protein